jgi:hypothetical protein
MHHTFLALNTDIKMDLFFISAVEMVYNCRHIFKIKVIKHAGYLHFL